MWVTAVAVHDFDEALRVAVQAGGTAPGQSVDIPTLGRFQGCTPARAEIHVVPRRPARRLPTVGEATIDAQPTRCGNASKREACLF